MAIALDLGLGGRFRKALINAPDVVSAWANAEIKRTRIRDIAFDKNHGLLVNPETCTRGIAVDTLPEGSLGTTFNGSGYVQVTNDGAGYTMPGDSAARNLSCFGGDIHVIVLAKWTSALLMDFVGKYAGGVDGWVFFAFNGAIGAALDKASASIFNFTGGSGLNDGLWHICELVADMSAGTAKLYADGAQVGSTATFSATDPPLTSYDLYIASAAGVSRGFRGTLSYVSVSRNSDAPTPSSLQATRAWTDVTADLAPEPIEVVTGTAGTTLRDRQAGIGTLDFTLHNAPTLGKYTIGHANQVAGFKLNIPVRLRDGSLIRFRGWLSQADPSPGVHGPWRVYCQAVDWFAIAARTQVTALPILTNVRSDDAWASLIDEADQPPVAISKGVGSTTLPYFGDRASGNVLSEMTDVIAAEAGQGYIRPDTSTGGVVTIEGRGVRQLDATPDATYDQTMRAMSVAVRVDAMVNIVNPTITPRDAGSVATDVVYIQERRQEIAPGQTLIVEGSYQDPSQSRSAVGATDFQAFTSGTDYTFTAAEDGTGVNLVGSLTESHIFGGSGFHIEFKNNHATAIGWVAYQIRGRLLLADKPLTPTVQDRDSVREHGPHPYDEEYKYLDDAETALSIGQLALNLFANTTKVPESVTFSPEPGSAFDASIRARAEGDLIALGDPQSNITTTQRYWIQNLRLVYRPTNMLEATFGVFPSFAQADDLFGAWDSTSWDDCLWGF